MAIEFQKGSSVLHKLDARTKLLMFVGVTVAAIVIADPVLLALLFIAVYFLGTRAVDRTMLNKNLRVLAIADASCAALQQLAARSMTLTATVQDGHVWLSSPTATVEIVPQQWLPRP